MAVTLLLVGCTKVQERKILNFWISSAPQSADPQEYDSFIHHIVFRSVELPLVTQYKPGRYTGLLADSWQASSNFREWTFKIRKGLFFENGATINAESVALSWRRLAFLQKKTNSHSGFLENLVGFENIVNASSHFDGLIVSGESITLKFNKSFPKLLDTLSFGLYSVVNKNDFDPVSGAWKDPKRVIASGPYRVDKWTDRSFTLVLREEFPVELRHARAYSRIEFSWSPETKKSSDVIYGTSNDADSSDEFSFYGAIPSSIAYVFCQSWSDPKSACHGRAARIALRTAFYQALQAQGVKTVKSFFPLAMSGVSELSEANPVHTPTFPSSVRYRKTSLQNPLFIAFNAALPKACRALGVQSQETNITIDELFRQSQPNLKSYTIDLSMRYTGILIDDPVSDIKFMFLSKEGIQLPDTDGSIIRELGKSQIDAQKINSILWDQAVVWPIGHFSMGLWARKHIDLSILNLALPPTELQWIGSK